MKINKLKLFSKNINGQVSIMMAVLMIPLAAMIGAGVDWAQQVNATSKMQSSVDSAILAVARATQQNEDISNSAQRIIAANIISQNLSVSSNVVLNEFAISYVDSLLKITHTATVETNFLKLVNVTTLPVKVISEIKMKFGSVDLALAVDLSFSMKGTKLSELKKATKILLNELEKASVGDMRVSFVPWTKGVNSGSYHDKLTKLKLSSRIPRRMHYDKPHTPPKPKPPGWKPKPKPPGWKPWVPPPKSCVLSKKTGLLSAVNTAIKHPEKHYWVCPKAKLIPLTSIRAKGNKNPGKTKLENAIKKWWANGGTESQHGMYWAWATLDPRFFPAFGTSKPKNPENVKRYAVIMTDGKNYKPWMDKQMLKTCTAMKKKKIKIYSIILQTNIPSVLDTFKQCASGNTAGRNYFIKANDASGLSAVFQKIAQEVGQFYISK